MDFIYRKIIIYLEPVQESAVYVIECPCNKMKPYRCVLGSVFSSVVSHQQLGVEIETFLSLKTFEVNIEATVTQVKPNHDRKKRGRQDAMNIFLNLTLNERFDFTVKKEGWFSKAGS